MRDLRSSSPSLGDSAPSAVEMKDRLVLLDRLRKALFLRELPSRNCKFSIV